MYKSLFISLNLVGLLMVPLLYIGDISVKQIGDSQVAAGDEMEVTIEITKEGVAGPARLKLDLSQAQGIEIEEIETEGASFSFNGTSALFIWYSIQPSDKVVLKYNIIADSDASGTKTITGSFSYLDEDERKKKDIEPFTFTVTSDGSVASTSTEEENIDVDEGGEDKPSGEAVDPESNETITTNEPETSAINEPTTDEEEEVADNSTEDEEATEATEEPAIEEEEESTPPANSSPPTTTSASIDDIKCSRTIENDGNNFIVTITINKGNRSGFARVKEDIPAGFTASGIETAGSIFKFADNAAKFLWSQIPASEDVVTVKYKLKPDAGTKGSFFIRGSFSAEFLVENDRPKKIKIPTTTIEVGENGLASAPIEDETPKNTYTPPSSTQEKEEIAEEVEEEREEESTTYQEPSTSVGSSTSANGIKYRVQIIAAHNTVSKRYVKKAFGFSGSFDIENHEGWVKYITGNYSTYKQARDKRNTLNSYDFDGPFVTAYNNGDRITVQEALMLSNQSWIQ